MEYVKLNRVPIKLYESRRRENMKFTEETQTYFNWKNKRYYLQDFTRTHNNPWVHDIFPEHIHGMQTNEYYNPLFVELIEDTHVNIYQETKPS